MAIKSMHEHSKPQKGPLMSKALMENSLVFRKLFGEERQELYKHTRAVSERELVPNTIALHKKEIPLESVLPMLGEIRGIGIPPQYGGDGDFHGIVDLVVLHQNLAYGSASASAFFDGNGLFVTPIILAGSEKQKQFYLPKIAAGEITGCYGLTDTESGSDVANMRSLSFSSEKESGFVLNGSKTFVTNGPVANYAVVFARERGNDEGYRNMSAFVVSAKAAERDGFFSEKPMDKLGWRASHTSVISMDAVFVPERDVLGEIGDGFRIAVTTLAYGRLKIAAEALGLMERALDETIKFVRERAGVGGPLKEQPLVQYQIAEIAQLIQATRDTVYNAAFLAEQVEEGRVVSFSNEAALAKSFAGRALQRVVNIALPLHGGYGFTVEYPISVIHADAPLYMIGEGADNVLAISAGASILGK